MTLSDKLAADEVVKRIEEIRAHGGAGSVEVHIQGGKVSGLRVVRNEAFTISK